MRGLSRGAGVSVVRAGREVAFGWFFMGEKRRENYDDWWRCEVSFDPALDEYFGLTNCKQQIAPVPELESILSADLEPVARLLNVRVRNAFLKLRRESATRVVETRERLLPPLDGKLQDSSTRRGAYRRHIGGLRYRMREVPSFEDAFYTFRLVGKTLTVILNTNHPFYRRIFEMKSKDVPGERFAWESVLFALARAEADAKDAREAECYRRKRVRWSNVLATFLGN